MNTAPENDVMRTIESCFLEIKIKGWRQLRAKTLKRNNIIGATESFLALSLGVSLHFQSRFKHHTIPYRLSCKVVARLQYDVAFEKRQILGRPAA